MTKPLRAFRFLTGFRFAGGLLAPRLGLAAIRARFRAGPLAVRLGLVPASTILATRIDVLISALSSRSDEARSRVSSCSEVALTRDAFYAFNSRG